MDPDSLRVHPPSNVVFLCGGALGDPRDEAKHFRDVFYRLHNGANNNYELILAEKAEPLEEDAGYRDLLSFESDIAQVAALIVLFVESAGSLAELGAFAALPTVAPNLLAILTDNHYAQKSFVRNGPIRFLEKQFGEEWVLSLDCRDLKINGSDLSEIEKIRFHEAVESAIRQRLDKNPASAKFDRDNAGHIILLITGLCQEYGALNRLEIERFLANFNLPDVRFENLVYCAQLMGWIKKIRKGNQILYVAREGDAALRFKFLEGVEQRDKMRWRTDIRMFWKSRDPVRLRAIADVNSNDE